MQRQHALRRLTDQDLEEICRGELGVVVVTCLSSGRCSVYQADIERLLAQGYFEGIPVGKLIREQPTAPQFLRANPWISALPLLPVTLLYRHNEVVDQFTTSRAVELVERVSRIREEYLDDDDGIAE